MYQIPRRHNQKLGHEQRHHQHERDKDFFAILDCTRLRSTALAAAAHNVILAATACANLTSSDAISVAVLEAVTFCKPMKQHL